MTDLRGEWFARISKNHTQPSDFFAFLERVNWLIFGDAYPQLLLYEEGLGQNRNLSYLLPAFHVSRFMVPIWDHFWHTKDSRLLTHALIINEQNYIESRVVKNRKYETSVLSSIQFQVQSLLNLSLVLLPFEFGNHTRVAGCVVDDFTSVHERIQTGLILYQMLYQDKLRHQALVRWMYEHRHTASRADYWPIHFTSQNALPKPAKYQPKFLGQSDSSRRIYSPELRHVWTDFLHEPAETDDWFRDSLHVHKLFVRVGKQPLDFTSEYVKSLQTTEGLLVAKEALGV